jgi:type IV pilus assembly protein PilM
MASGQTVWGIDLGRCALRAIRLRALTNELVEVVGYSRIEHDTVLTESSANRDVKIAEALEKFLSQHDISSDQVVVSVPGQHTLARFSPLPPVEAKKIPDLVRYEADQQIPFDLDEVIWDYQTFQEKDTPEIQVGIFAMKRELLREYLGHYEAAGIEPIIVQAAPLALYNAARFDGMIGDGTVVLLNIGAENTDLILAGKETLWTRTIPIGGNNFTEALVKAFKLSFSKAENLKKGAATSKYARRIFQAMRPVFADLVQELQRSIGRYTSAHRDAELTRVIGVGNAFKLPVLAKYLQQNLQLDVKRPETFERAQLTGAADDPQFKEILPSYAVAYGLALQGLGLTKIRTNLLPPEIARQVLWRKKRPYFGAAAACLVLAAGVIWLRNYWDTSTLKEAQGNPPSVTTLAEAGAVIATPPTTGAPRERAERILSAAEVLRQEYDRISSGGGTQEQKIKQIQQLVENKAILLKILEVIHEALPTPQRALAEATTCQEYRQAVQDSGLRRPERDEVFIARLDCRYEPDLSDPALDSDFRDVSREVDPNLVQGGPASPRGFIFRLQCRTPNAQLAEFVNAALKQNLRTLGRRPNAGFYINRVAMTAYEPMHIGTEIPPPTDYDRSAPFSSGRGQRRERGPGGSSGGRDKEPESGAPPAEPVGTYIDPLTNESMDSDWLFSIAFDVVLADLPEPEAQPGQS